MKKLFSCSDSIIIQPTKNDWWIDWGATRHNQWVIKPICDVLGERDVNCVY